METILITGFTPFDGRNINASWLTACAMHRPGLTETLRLPVEWGQPGPIINKYCDERKPHTIIGLGEGRAENIDIETVALSTPKQRLDNQNQMPPDKDCQRRVNATFDVNSLQRALISNGYSAGLSADAGQFLCEETLFALEIRREIDPHLKNVLFVHVPPFGSRFDRRVCLEPFYEDFGNCLLDIVTEITEAGT